MPICISGERSAAANLMATCWKPQIRHSSVVIRNAWVSMGRRVSKLLFGQTNLNDTVPNGP